MRRDRNAEPIFPIAADLMALTFAAVIVAGILFFLTGCPATTEPVFDAPPARPARPVVVPSSGTESGLESDGKLRARVEVLEKAVAALEASSALREATPDDRVEPEVFTGEITIQEASPDHPPTVPIARIFRRWTIDPDTGEAVELDTDDDDEGSQR